MGNGLATRANHQDGSARLVQHTVDPNTTGTTDTDEELVLLWDELDIRQENTLLQLYRTKAAFTGIKVNGNLDVAGTWYVAEQPKFIVNDETKGTLIVVFTETTLAGKSFPYEQRTIGPYTAGRSNRGLTTRTVYINHKILPTLGAVNGFLRIRKNIYNRYDGTLDVITATTIGGIVVPGDTWIRYRAVDSWGDEIHRIVYTRYVAASQGPTASLHVRTVYRWVSSTSVPLEDAIGTNYRQGRGSDMKLIARNGLWKAWSVTDDYT